VLTWKYAYAQFCKNVYTDNTATYIKPFPIFTHCLLSKSATNKEKPLYDKLILPRPTSPFWGAWWFFQGGAPRNLQLLQVTWLDFLKSAVTLYTSTFVFRDTVFCLHCVFVFSQTTNYTVLCATVYCKFITSSLLK
jgi:hypothetical protein